MQQYQLNVESRSTALQNELTTITANYRERTKESKAQYHEYKQKDEKNSKEIRDATIYINRITVYSFLLLYFRIEFQMDF